jgi:CheY-like chemotaxis protein/chemotaxis protein histidine kinase CheA
MAFNSSIDRQACELFLAEALEVYQQVEEGLLLAHVPNALNLKKLVLGVQTIRQGAQQVELVDIQLLTAGLETVLKTCESTIESEGLLAQDLLQHLCNALQLSLIAHRSVIHTTTASEHQDFVLHSLVPKTIDILDAVFAQPLPGEIRHELLLQQIQCIHWWNHSLNLSEMETIAKATLNTLQTFPQSIDAIASVALAGFQVAHEAALQRSIDRSATIQPVQKPLKTEPVSTPSQPSSNPQDYSLNRLNPKDFLVGLAHQKIFCVATDSILEIVVPQTEQLLREEDRDRLLWGDRRVPLFRFSDLWQPDTLINELNINPTSALILVLNHEIYPVALSLQVDRLIVDTALELHQREDILPSTRQYCRYGWAVLDNNWLEVVDVNCLLRQYLSTDVPSELRTISETQLSEWPATQNSDFLWATATEPSSKTILIVDDSRTVREILSTTLQTAGYEVLQAQDGQEAIAHLQLQPRIDLTICDIEMSNLNGFEFLRQRLQDERWAHIPVLILSSHTSQEYRQLAQKLGAAEYFTIPYNAADLLNAIAKLLQA